MSSVKESNINNNEIEIKYEGSLWNFDNIKAIAEVDTIKEKYKVTAEAISAVITNFFEGYPLENLTLDNTAKEWKDKPTGIPNSIWATNLLLNEIPIIFEDTDSNSRRVVSLTSIITGIELNAQYQPFDVCPLEGDALTASRIMQYAIYRTLVY